MIKVLKELQFSRPTFLFLGTDGHTARPEAKFDVCCHKATQTQLDRLFVICLSALKGMFDILENIVVCFLAQRVR